MIRNQCQFSWYCDGKSDRMINEELENKVKIVVRETLALWYNNIDITEGATHYHANYVNPTWAKTLNYTTQIGTHKYYRWN
jgi:spore germination cell wall hydrolase CwlJ-like protein